MTKYGKKAILQIIVNAAKEYDKKLKDKQFLIILDNKGKVQQKSSSSSTSFKFTIYKKIISAN